MMYRTESLRIVLANIFDLPS